MKEISTLSNLWNHLQAKKKKSELLKPREESIQMILSYSKSLKCIKTSSVGNILIVNN